MVKLKIRIESQWYLVEVDDANSDCVEVKVDDHIFTVTLKQDSLSESVIFEPILQVNSNDPALSKYLVKTSAFITPMPGIIIEILVKAGDHVSKGDDICILESMKMQQTLKSNFNGEVIDILVSSGAQVSDGQELIKYS
jgi:biotin carboxyl carrier protein